MSSTMASLPHHARLALPPLPRVRPPRILKGTPQANTDPQPSGEVPWKEGGPQAWVQGKWRTPTSNAAKDRQVVQSRQVEKALQHDKHGMNIYAYSHIRTNQVIYSLTKVMENNKMMPQLLYHKKKTVPSALRRDLWRPYFSIHFPQTPAGAQKGLRVYQMLRELSLKRQLSPPKEFLITKSEDVERAKAKYDPANLHLLMKQHKVKLPNVGQLLPKKLRAKKLMDQKAYSVADVAFVLEHQNSTDRSPLQWLQDIKAQREQKHKELSRRARKRINTIRSEEEKKEEEISARQLLVVRDGNLGQLNLTRHAAERIAIEHAGAISGSGQVRDLQAVKKHNEEAEEGVVAENENSITLQNGLDASQSKADSGFDAAQDESRAVEIRWADTRDATYASNWSRNIIHDKLEPKAVVKKQISGVRQYRYFDEEMNEIVEQRATFKIQASSSPHIIGGRLSDKELGDQPGWYVSPDEIQKEADRRREERVEQWGTTKAVLAYRNSLALRDEVEKIEKRRVVREYLASRVLTASEEVIDGEALDAPVASAPAFYHPALPLLDEAEELLHKLSSDMSELENLKKNIGFKSKNQFTSEQLESSVAEYNAELLNLFERAKAELKYVSKKSHDMLALYAQKLLEQFEFDQRHPIARTHVTRHKLWSQTLSERERLISEGEELEKSTGHIQSNAAKQEIESSMGAIRQAIAALDEQVPPIANMMQEEHNMESDIAAREDEIEHIQGRMIELKESIETATQTPTESKNSTTTDIETDTDISSLRATYDHLESQLRELHNAQARDRTYRDRAQLAFVFGKDSTDNYQSGIGGKGTPNTLEEMGVEGPQKKQGLWSRLKGMVGR